MNQYFIGNADVCPCIAKSLFYISHNLFTHAFVVAQPPWGLAPIRSIFCFICKKVKAVTLGIIAEGDKKWIQFGLRPQRRLNFLR